jgi:ABC-type uncharacterized transport system auxiliary subunit
MVRQKIILIVILCLALNITACLKLKQPRNEITYYTLEYDPPDVAAQRCLPYVIRVNPFSASPVYNTNRIIYSDKSFKRQAYAYYKWRANPAELIAYFLKRDLEKSGLFKAVLARDNTFPPAYLLEGTVEEFLEADKENTWEALLSVSIALIDENEPDISQKILFQKSYQSSRNCREKNPQALAAALSQAMSQVSKEVINDTYKALANRPEKK